MNFNCSLPKTASNSSQNKGKKPIRPIRFTIISNILVNIYRKRIGNPKGIWKPIGNMVGFGNWLSVYICAQPRPFNSHQNPLQLHIALHLLSLLLWLPSSFQSVFFFFSLQVSLLLVPVKLSSKHTNPNHQPYSLTRAIMPCH